jgi:probable HAF family extracellular repeat protein
MPTTEFSPSSTASRGRTAERWTAASVLALMLMPSSTDVAVANPFLDDDLIDIVHTGYIGDVYHQGFWKSTIGGNLGGMNDYATSSFYFYLPDGAQADGTNTSVLDLSGDGTTAVGGNVTASGWRPFYWTETGGFTTLDIGTTATLALATRVSNDGTAIAGFASVSGVDQAFYWQAGDSEITLLGTLGGSYSNTNAISGDGTTVVGQSTTGSSVAHGFVWQHATGMVDVGVLAGGQTSNATHVSNDGSVVGVSSETATGWHAARWTAAGLEDLGTLGGTYSEIRAMDENGSVIVGISTSDAGTNEAFRWEAGNGSAEGSMVSIQSSDFVASEANDVNADGTVVVGTAYLTAPSTGPGSPAPETRGFRWSERSGMVSVDDWLRSNGVTLAADITETAHMVSSDGTRIFGGTLDDGYYLAQVTDETSGIIDVEDYIASAAQANSTATGLQMSSASTIMFGAQGSPMRSRLAEGRRSVWGTIDTGYDSGTRSEGGLVIGDFGFGYGLSDDVTLRLSGGLTYTNQDLYQGGEFRARGWYVAPEVTARLIGDLYVTAGGIFGRGSLDIDRGYLNGSTPEISNGETETETLAGKLRLDWLNAFTLGDAAFSPYAGISRVNATTDAYSETGGSFPASHDAVKDHATVARLGLDGSYELNDTVTLLARAEAAYRFENQTASTSTEVAGVTMSVAGDSVRQFWLRGGIGGEMAVGGGTAALMLNVTTESDDTDVWLRSGWKVDF